MHATYLEIVSAWPKLIPLGAIWSCANVRPVDRALGRKSPMDTFPMPVEVILRAEARTTALAVRPGAYVGFRMAKNVLSLSRENSR